MLGKAWGGTGRILNGFGRLRRVAILCSVDGLALLAASGAVIF
jgi:hypothetical protein